MSRVVKLRLGVILDKNHGALPRIAKMVKNGIGSPLGDGQQYMPWIHIEDAVSIFFNSIKNDKISVIELKIGDEITVYHADKTPLQRNRDLRLNKTVQFIDKDAEAYFIRGNKDKFGGYILGGIGLLLGITLLILKQVGKIK